MRLLLLILLMASMISPSAYGQGSLDAIAHELTDIDYDFGRWPYPLYAEVTERLEELAAQHPERFRRIVVAGVGRNLFESDPARGAAVIEAVRTGEASNPELRYFADLPDAAGADRAALTAFLQRPDRRVFSAELLAGVRVPVQVVLGDRDFAAPADLLVEALPDATSVTLRGVDHFATPRDFGFIDAALGFLDAQPF